MSINEIKNSFEKGNLDKWKYIDEMYKQHALLFDYSNFIPNTNISLIEISDKRVVMTFRDSGVKFICIENDKRLAPLDTLNFGSYEVEELRMQLNLIDDGMNVFDIGGNLGWFALHIAKLKPKSTTFSFEPLPTTFKYLNENISLNKFSNIKIFNFGLSDKVGTFSFFYNPQLSVNASMLNVADNHNIEEIKCSVKTLDGFMHQEKTTVDFIKCDVEGAELLAYKGGVETIKQNQPIIFSEMLRKWTTKFNYHPNDIIKFFSELNYECFVIQNERLKRFTTVNETTEETNYFFMHSQKHAAKIYKFLSK